MVTRSYKQDPPNALQIELVEGCSLNCRFCGVQGIRETRGDYKYMTIETMHSLVDKLKIDMRDNAWNPRVEFAMHGEPTVHPELLRMASIVGTAKPREFIVVSNGTGFIKNPRKIIDTLVSCGVTSICLDEYDGCDFVSTIRSKYDGAVPIYEYNGTNDNKFRGSGRKFPFIMVKQDMIRMTKPYDKINTHCGGGCNPGSVNPAINKKCAKPFRELSVRWDGNVAICCNDFRGIYKIGNLLNYSTLEDLWQSPGFQAARTMLYAGDRDFVPCKWCDALSTRVGLLPDKHGKKSLGPPTKYTRDTIDRAISGEPYTKPVLRGWETQETAYLPPLYTIEGLKRQSID